MICEWCGEQLTKVCVRLNDKTYCNAEHLRLDLAGEAEQDFEGEYDDTETGLGCLDPWDLVRED